MSSEPVGVPVFVDPSGRRARWVRVAFGSVAGLASLYVATVALSLVLPAGALHLSIPGLGPVLAGPAPALVRPPHGGPAGLVVPAPSPEPSDVSTDLAPSRTPGTGSQPAGGTPLGATPVVRVTPAAGSTPPVATRPSTAPSAAAGHPSSHPAGGPSASGHPTPQPSPRPSNGHGHGGSPSPSKSPRSHPTPSHK